MHVRDETAVFEFWQRWTAWKSPITCNYWICTERLNSRIACNYSMNPQLENAITRSDAKFTIINIHEEEKYHLILDMIWMGNQNSIIYRHIPTLSVKVTHKRTNTLVMLVGFPIGSLQRGLCSTSVYCGLLCVRHRALEDCIRLVNV